MFCRGILLSKANVAPERLKVWKPCPDGEILRVAKIDFNASLTFVSMTC